MRRELHDPADEMRRLRQVIAAQADTIRFLEGHNLDLKIRLAAYETAESKPDGE